MLTKPRSRYRLTHGLPAEAEEVVERAKVPAPRRIPPVNVLRVKVTAEGSVSMFVSLIGVKPPGALNVLGSHQARRRLEPKSRLTGTQSRSSAGRCQTLTGCRSACCPPWWMSGEDECNVGRGDGRDVAGDASALQQRLRIGGLVLRRQTSVLALSLLSLAGRSVQSGSD